MTQSRTLASAFDPRRNSLNALRLLLATTVIVSHVWPYGGYGPDPGSGPDTSNLGSWALAGFFAISGWLITASRLNSRSLVDYLWRRLLRIYPAYLVAILLTAFVFAPIGVQLATGNSWSWGTAIHFVVQALPLFLTAFAPTGSLLTVPAAELWVGTLWTLAFEFGCYLVIGFVVSFVRNRRALLAVVAAWFVLSTAGTLAHELLGTNENSTVARFLRLGAFFAAGALVYLLRERVPLSHGLAAASVVLLAALILLGGFTLLAGLPMAYLMMYLGCVLPLSRVGSRNDVSYGMYIYGPPVAQFLVLVFGAAALPLPLFLVLAVVLTIPFAWLSWLLVERPALRLKRLTAGTRPDREGHVPVGLDGLRAGQE